MNIEAGKFYRMRCGGAVKIDKISFGLAETDYTSWDSDDGYWDNMYAPTPFDLIAEITEVEYNAIISGTAFDRISARVSDEEKEQVKAQLDGLDMQALKAENEELRAEVQTWQALHAEACGNNARIRNDRRFEAAKAAMQGMLSNADLDVLQDTEWIANHARAHADALIKAFEETK